MPNNPNNHPAESEPLSDEQLHTAIQEILEEDTPVPPWRHNEPEDPEEDQAPGNFRAFLRRRGIVDDENVFIPTPDMPIFTPTPNTVIPQPNQIRPIATEEIIDHVFHCPDCNNETDWIRVWVATRGSDYGGYSPNNLIGITEQEFESLDISFDDSNDSEREGENNWECDNCGRDLSYATIISNLRERRRTIQVQKGTNTRKRNNTQKELLPDENHYNVITGENTARRHVGDTLPDAFAPEVVSSFQHKAATSGYTVKTTCPKCSHDFMIGPEDSNIVCPKCQLEFDIRPQRLPENVTNEQQRRRRFAAAFGNTDERN